MEFNEVTIKLLLKINCFDIREQKKICFNNEILHAVIIQ